MKKLKSLFIYIITVIITLFFLEVYLQYSEISLPSYYIDDPKFGVKFKPNADIMSIAEGFCMTTINEYGFRGKNYKLAKDKNTIRIALLGDSFVEAIQLFDQYHFGTILERNLESKADKNFEVLNFGKSGLDFRGMYIYYEELVKKFNPDITLFIIRTGDLIEEDNSNGIGPKCELDNDSLNIDFGFSNSEAFRQKLKISFLRNFAFYSLLQSSYITYKSGRSDEILLGKLNQLFKENNNQTLTENTSEKPDNLLPINKKILESLSNSNSINYIVTADELPENYKSLINYYNLPTINLYEFIQEISENGLNAFYWKATNKLGHWNHVAHSEIGRFLSRQLIERIN